MATLSLNKIDIKRGFKIDQTNGILLTVKL